MAPPRCDMKKEQRRERVGWQAKNTDEAARTEKPEKKIRFEKEPAAESADKSGENPTDEKPALKKRTVRKRLLAAAVTLAALIVLLSLGMQTAVFLSAAVTSYWHPDYEKEDIASLLDKEELTEEDYDLLYRQTGLTAIGVERCLARGEEGKQRILEIQEDYFRAHPTRQSYFSPFFATAYIDEPVTHCYLQEGDVLVTSSTQFSGMAMGHAGLVTDASSGGVLQTSAYGAGSAIDSVEDFTGRVTFLLLSPKADKETKLAVSDYAEKELVGLPYSIAAGILTDKESGQETQCAHIVWYAYRQFGIDLDSDGGRVVTPRDLANSDEMEVVQVFGFDPETLWR